MLASIIAVCEISYEIAKKRRKYKLIIAAEQERDEKGNFYKMNEDFNTNRKRSMMRRPSRRGSVSFTVQKNGEKGGWEIPNHNGQGLQGRPSISQISHLQPISEPVHTKETRINITPKPEKSSSAMSTPSSKSHESKIIKADIPKIAIQEFPPNAGDRRSLRSSKSSEKSTNQAMADTHILDRLPRENSNLSSCLEDKSRETDPPKYTASKSPKNRKKQKIMKSEKRTIVSKTVQFLDVTDQSSMGDISGSDGEVILTRL